MIPERIEALRHEYADEDVLVQASGPNLARFRGRKGRVITITAGGRALVQFEGADRGWYDLDLDFLKVIDRPEPGPKECEPAPAEGSVARNGSVGAEEGEGAALSELERARLNRPLASPSPTNGG